VVTAQEQQYTSSYVVKILRSKAPVIYTQLVKGSLRSALCLLPNPSICHLPEYFMAGVRVNATNPHDGVTVNSTISDAQGGFLIQIPFSEGSMGKLATLQVHWASPSAQANLPNGGVQMSTLLGEYNMAGQGFANDLQHDAGFLYWYPVQMPPATITGRVLNAMTNKAVKNEQAMVSVYSSVTRRLVATKKSYRRRLGAYKFSDLPPGMYDLQASAPGMNTVNLTNVAWNREGAALVMSPRLYGSEVRFVMSWEEYPKPGTKDMDVHLLFRPSPTKDCDVNFAWKKCAHAQLDRDNIQGGQAGAETITIEKPLSTVYTLFLDNYSGALGGWRTLESAIQDGSWSYPSIPASKFEGVPPTGWATELSGAVVRVLDQSGELMTVKVPAHPEDPASAHLYRDVPTSKFNGGYRKESRYVRLLCIDFRQSPPVIHKVPQFSSTPPQTMASCI